jgi:hypothetical protein
MRSASIMTISIFEFDAGQRPAAEKDAWRSQQAQALSDVRCNQIPNRRCGPSFVCAPPFGLKCPA